MFVADLMQCEVVTLQASDTLDLADDIMRLGRIRQLPVVVGERVVGTLSQRDLFRAAISSLLQPRYATEREWLARIPVLVRDVAGAQITASDADNDACNPLQDGASKRARSRAGVAANAAAEGGGRPQRPRRFRQIRARTRTACTLLILAYRAAAATKEHEA